MPRRRQQSAKPVELSDEEIDARVKIARKRLAHRARIQATFNTVRRVATSAETRLNGLGDYVFTGATCAAILATLATVGTLTKPRHEIIGEFPSTFANLPPPPAEPESDTGNPWDKIEATRAAEFRQARKAAAMKKAQEAEQCRKFGSHCDTAKLMRERHAIERAQAYEATKRARELCELFDVGCKRKGQ